MNSSPTPPSQTGVLLSGRYVTAEDYALRVGQSVATVKRWCKLQEEIGTGGRVAKVGRQWLIKVEDQDA